MPDFISLASLYDQQSVSVLQCLPCAERRGGLVLLHEIFGLDETMLRDAGRWSQAGYEVLAPSLFDRCERGFSSAHDGPGIERGMACLKKTPDDQALGDISTCVEALLPRGPVFVLGYCYGGRLAWAAAARLQGISAAVTYYGNVLAQVDVQPRCPVMMHFGGKDPHLPVAEIAMAMRQRHPYVQFKLYPHAGHGFNHNDGAGPDSEDALQARRCTQDFFGQWRG